jgi:ribosomal protein S18 acetylase RimI-like enzyme
MVCTSLPGTEPPLPPGTRLVGLANADYAEEVGALRGSPLEQRSAHAQRLAMSPVRFEGCAIRRDADGAVLACAQMAAEADLVGLYDVYTREEARSQGLARLLCERLLSLAAKRGARVAYLQVEADNGSARRVYERLGFADRYAYHYRQAPAGL